MFLFYIRSKDVHLLKYATKIVLKNDHNHSTNCADSVKYKDVPDNVRDEFIKLFQQGFHPYKALDVFKENLLLKNDKDYYLLSQNRSVCPDITWCYRYDCSLVFEILNFDFGSCIRFKVIAFHILSFSGYITPFNKRRMEI